MASFNDIVNPTKSNSFNDIVNNTPSGESLTPPPKTNTLGAYARTLGQAVKQIPANLASTIEGNTPYNEQNISDELINKGNANQQEFENQPNAGSSVFGGLGGATAKDIYQVAPSLSGSMVSMAPTIAGASAGASIGSLAGPVGTAIGAGIGGLAGTALGYYGMKRQSENQFIRQNIDKANQENEAKGLPPLTQPEAIALQDKLNASGDVDKYGTAEALGEAGGNVAELGIAATPLGKFGKVVGKLGSPLARAAIVGGTKAAGITGTEIGEELGTNLIQNPINKKYGFPEQSVGNTAYQTAIATAPFALLGGGHGAVQGYRGSLTQPQAQVQEAPQDQSTQEPPVVTTPTITTVAPTGPLTSAVAAAIPTTVPTRDTQQNTGAGTVLPESTSTLNVTTNANEPRQSAPINTTAPIITQPQSAPGSVSNESVNAVAQEKKRQYNEVIKIPRNIAPAVRTAILDEVRKGATYEQALENITNAAANTSTGTNNSDTNGRDNETGLTTDAIGTEDNTTGDDHVTTAPASRAPTNEALGKSRVNNEEEQINPKINESRVEDTGTTNEHQNAGSVQPFGAANNGTGIDVDGTGRANNDHELATFTPTHYDTNNGQEFMRLPSGNFVDEDLHPVQDINKFDIEPYEPTQTTTPPKEPQQETQRASTPSTQPENTTDHQSKATQPADVAGKDSGVVEGLDHIDKAAHEAASSPFNEQPEPTPAQKEAGNYKKGHIKNYHGLNIAIENPKGSIRSGTDKAGNAWSNTLQHHYGYIKGTMGADKDHVDVFLGDNHDSTKVFVVNQINPDTGKFDEHKVMLGFDNKEDADAAYHANYHQGWNGAQSIVEMPIDELKAKIKDKVVTKPFIESESQAILNKHPTIKEALEQRKESNEPKTTNEPIPIPANSDQAIAPKSSAVGEVKAQAPIANSKGETRFTESAARKILTSQVPQYKDVTEHTHDVVKDGDRWQVVPISQEPGKLGDKLRTGETRLTSSGRRTTPFPNFTGKNVKDVDTWLINNAYEEAKARNDNFNARMFKNDIGAKIIPPASKDSAEEYLFGTQPEVQKSITKPLINQESNVKSSQKQTENAQETPRAEKPTDVKQPWELSKSEWDKERANARPDSVQSNFTKASGSQAAANMNKLLWLLDDVTKSASDTLKAAEKGDIKLNKDEVEHLLDVINTPVTHYDVVKKAIAEGKPVPKEVLADYPELNNVKAEAGASGLNDQTRNDRPTQDNAATRPGEGDAERQGDMGATMPDVQGQRTVPEAAQEHISNVLGIDDFTNKELDESGYKSSYEKSPQLLKEFKESAKGRWREQVESATERLPDHVIDEYVNNYGMASLQARMRGVHEKAIEGWMPKDIREQAPTKERRLRPLEKAVYERTWPEQREVSKQGLSRKLTVAEFKEIKDDWLSAINKAKYEGKVIPANVLESMALVSNKSPKPTPTPLAKKTTSKLKPLATMIQAEKNKLKLITPAAESRAINDANESYVDQIKQDINNGKTFTKTHINEIANNQLEHLLPREDLKRIGYTDNTIDQLYEQSNVNKPNHDKENKTIPIHNDTPTTTSAMVKDVGNSENGQTVSNAKTKTNRKAINNSDDLLTAIAKLGGITRTDAIAQGIDPAALNLRKAGVFPVFHNGGKATSYDGMAETLRQYGFDTPNANSLVQQVSDAVNQGAKIYNAEGAQEIAKILHEERVNEEQTRHISDIDMLLDAYKENDPEQLAFIKQTIIKGNITPDNIHEYWDDINDTINRREQASKPNSTETVEPEELKSYTESELAAKEREQKQREKSVTESELKARQKAQADKEIDDVSNDFLGANPASDDLFGGNPMANMGKADKVVKVSTIKDMIDADKKSPEYLKAQADLNEALGDLGKVFLSANLFAIKAVSTELSAKDLIPVLAPVMDAAFRMGYAEFKANAKFVLDTIRNKFGDAAADSITIDHLQGSYIAMGKGVTSKKDVVNVDSIDEINEPEQDKNNENNTGAKTNVVADTSKAPAQPGISNQEQRPLEQTGVESSAEGLRDGQQRIDAVDSSQSQGNELPGNEGMAGHTTNGGNKQPISGAVSDNASVSGHLGADNYSLIGKPNIELTPAKRRDINNVAEEILKKPVSDITEADKNILRQYTGNGGLDLKSSADKGESIFNQHYTSYDTIKAMYAALSDAGIKMDNNLEPSVGSGNFIGMHPRANWTAVDVDKVNTEVVERLYPDAKVFNESYETFRGQNFDLIISNVPFASFSSLARKHAGTIKPAFKAIHNFFFAQSIDKVKTNGVVAFMTSTGTMDGTSEAQLLRCHIIKQMDVIGAYRLPMGSQKANASTDVMIDVIFLQKRPVGIPSKQPEKNQSFVDIASKDGYKINQFFVDYPESVLGELSIDKNKTSMGKVGWIVTGKADYSKMKIEPQDYTSTERREHKSNDFANHDTAQAYADKHGYKFIDQETKPFFKDGIIYDTPVTYNEQSGGGLFGRKATGLNAEKLEALQKIDETHDAELVHKYEEKYGKAPQADKALQVYAKNNLAEQQLKFYSALFDKDFNLSEIFSKQVRFENSGKIEIDEHSPLLDRAESLENADGIFTTKSNLVTPEERQELLDSGDYASLANGSLQNARLYYAGNIYKKLDDANKVKPAAQRDKQIAKLERIKPTLILIKNITITGKESWLPDSAIVSIGKQSYPDGTVIIGENAIADNYLLHLFNQYVNNEPLVKKGKDDTPEEYADSLKSAQNTLHNDVIPLIKQKLMDDGLADEVVDAYNRAKNFFVAPAFDGSSLRNLPTTFKGKPFNLMIHQQEGIERAIYNKKGVLAFSPGLGKTPAAIIVADQLLQKGVMKKPLFIVPANTIPQWESSTRSLYPDAKVYEFPKYTTGINKGKPKEWPSMTASDKEKMVYDLTNNQYDYTFISTNLAQKFSVPTRTLSRYLDELTESISGMEKDDEELTKSQIKAKATRLAKIAMLKETMMTAYRDSAASGFDMGKMGFDALFADEVQYYKNIGMQSEDAKGGIGGSVAINAKYPLDAEGLQDKTQDPLSVTLGSSRSYDFRFKTRFISENNNGNNVFLLTGTPTPNKPLELMTLLHHLDTHILDEYGINNVGEFVDEFLDVQEVEEMAVDGTAKLKPQLVGIKNIFGLKKIISRFVDYRSPESAPDLTRPKQIDKTHIVLKNSDAETIFADIQKRILQSIDDSKAKMQGDKYVTVETMITMYGAGRDGSIDVRLYTPSKYDKGDIAQGTVFEKETRSEYSKIAKTVELVAAKNKQDPEAGQLIFLDRLKFADGSGSTHEDIRNDILKATGLNPQEVVFVNGGEYVNPNTGKVAKNIKPEMLQTIMDDYNAGKIKVLIGNTSKLGVGVDLQVTTTDIYQIDKPYRPDEIEQRNNRGVRQGNRNTHVTVHTFNQPGTFDAMSDRIIANKQGFNDVFWKDQDSDRADVKGEEAPGHYDAAIELEQNPIKKRKLEIDRDLSQASGKTNDLEKQVSSLAKRIRIATQNSEGYAAANNSIKNRETPKYEDQTDAERKKSVAAFKKRMAEQHEKNIVRIADLASDLIKLNKDKESRKQELNAHKEYIAGIRDKYVVNGVVSLDAIERNGDIKFSKRDTQTTGSTISQITALLPNRVKGMLAAGRLVIVQNVSDLHANLMSPSNLAKGHNALSANIDATKMLGVEALYDNKTDTIYLVADMLNKDNLNITLTHELLHRAEAKDPATRAALKRFEQDLERRFNLNAKDIGTKEELEAYRRVINADTPVKDHLSEYIAYMGGLFAKSPNSLTGAIKQAFQRLIAAIRMALVRAGLDMGMVRHLTPADLWAMSKYGAAVSQKQSANIAQSNDANALASFAGKSAKTADNDKGYSEQDKKDLDSLFTSLSSRANPSTRAEAMERIDTMPNADKIRYVENNFYDILGKLEESGKVIIKC